MKLTHKTVILMCGIAKIETQYRPIDGNHRSKEWGNMWRVIDENDIPYSKWQDHEETACLEACQNLGLVIV